MNYREISRDEVPAHSFRYGQLARVKRFDVPEDVWAVCTEATHFDENEDMSTVLVAHFLHRSADEAREQAERLSSSGHHGTITVVRPS
jgi:hypothetical protein